MNTLWKQDSFWTSYADLMTSLFFVMFVLFIMCLAYVGGKNKELGEKVDTYENIIHLQEQFEVLSKSSHIKYDDEKKMFYVPDFQGIEIFLPNNDVIKQEYLCIVDTIGRELDSLLANLNTNKKFHYQLVIEGTAAIPYQKLKDMSYNPDNEYVYNLSYRRALALYQRWKNLDIDLREYNTEIIIAGSGFSGINRDEDIEENNKRFVIQIIPKVDRPIPVGM